MNIAVDFYWPHEVLPASAQRDLRAAAERAMKLAPGSLSRVITVQEAVDSVRRRFPQLFRPER